MIETWISLKFDKNPNCNYCGYCLLLKTENWKYCSRIIFKCVNNTGDLTLMKILLKKSTYRSRKQCMGPTELDANAAESNL